MRRDYLYLSAIIVLLGAAVIWMGIQKADFVLAEAKTGVPPEARTLVIYTEKPVPPESLGFVIKPGPISILGIRRVGKGAFMLLLSAPLEAGKSYELKAVKGLNGTVRFQVQPLRMVLSPVVFYGPSREPAILLTSNAPLPLTDIPLHDSTGAVLSVRRVSLSSREALYLLDNPPPSINIPSSKTETEEIRGGRIHFEPSPFQLRESSVEEAGGRWRIRLRFSHWIEGRVSQATSYISLADGIPFTMEARAIDLYLYPEVLPSGPFRLELRKGFPGGDFGLAETEKLVLAPQGAPSFSWYQPYAHFTAPGTPLLFQAGSAKTVTIQIWRILPQNVRLFFRQKAENLWMNYPSTANWWENIGWWGWWEHSELSAYAELVRRAELPVSILRKVQKKNQTLYAIGEDLPPGVYAVEISGETETLRNWFVVGSYGLIARRGVEGVHIWALSHGAHELLAGVEMELWGAAGQVISRNTTNRSGYAFLPLPDTLEPEGIWTVWNSEPNYLPLRGLRPGRWTFETGGIDPARSGLLIYFAAARTLFRPGEKVEVAGTVRTLQLRYVASQLWGRLREPRGRILWTGSIQCARDGGFLWEYQLPLSASTGSYTLELLNAPEGELISSFPFQVEVFSPNRLEITLTQSVTDDKLRIRSQVSYLYGTPAANLAGTIDVRWKSLSIQGEPEYVWEPTIPSDSLIIAAQTDLRTDAHGRTEASFSLPRGYGYGEIRAIARFTDDEGRINSHTGSMFYASQPYIVGMRRLPPYLRSGAQVVVLLKGLRGADLRPASESIPIRVEVIERQYEPILVEQPWGGYRQEYRPVERIFHRAKIELSGGVGQIAFTPRLGQYEIRVWAPQQRFPTTQIVEIWGWGDESLLPSDPEGGIEIKPQSPIVKAGEKARLLVKLPLPGRLLITAEREKVYHSQWVTSKGDVVEVEIPTNLESVPGFYVHAMALHGEGSPFRVSRGVYYIPIEGTNTAVKVEVAAPARSAPGERFSIKVKAGAANARLIVAGVDAGILPNQRKDIQNPHDFFYQKRAHTIKISEQFPYTTPWGAGIVGGGEGSEDMLSDEGLQPERAEKLVSFFWANLQTDAKGEASVEVQLPPFTGKVRWRAYVMDEQRFGMGETYTAVVLPIVGRLSLPDVISQGDELLLPLTLQNTTETPQSGRWRIVVQGEGLQLSEQEGDFSLLGNASMQKTLILRCVGVVGRVRVGLLVQNYSLQEQEVLIRPAEAFQRLVKTYVVQPGEELRLPDIEGDFARKKIRIIGGSLPVVQYAGALYDLMEFPHGCAEQITSQAFASLTAGPWLEKLLGLPTDTQKSHILNVLRQLSTFQTMSGGFGFWSGGPEDNWLSVYITHFLYEAQKAGYSQARPLYERALQYQRSLFTQTPPGSRTQAYRALLLTRALGEEVRSGFPSVSDINQIDDPVILALWRGACAQVRLPLPKPPKGLPTATGSSGGELITPMRDLALMLYGESFVPSSRRSPLVQTAQSHLLEHSRTLSTQEASWLLLALNQQIKPLPVELRYQKRLSTHDEPVWAEELADAYGISIVNKGSSPAYIAYVIEGLPVKPLVPVSSGFRLNATLAPENGKTMTAGARLTWRIDIQVENTLNLPLRNVALSMPLPSAWSVESFRLSEDRQAVINGAELEHIEQRDDRVVLYLTLREPEIRIHVPVRVRFAGRYSLPSMSLIAMYDPLLHATTPSQVLRSEPS
ncbi:MAG: MG2 domain-containing protein [Bacteroidia bacterium]|nr:MG2 domain-containing protein [Bacteroidia bacterium]